jgi:hypothetical protein
MVKLTTSFNFTNIFGEAFIFNHLFSIAMHSNSLLPTSDKTADDVCEKKCVKNWSFFGSNFYTKNEENLSLRNDGQDYAFKDSEVTLNKEEILFSLLTTFLEMYIF